MFKRIKNLLEISKYEVSTDTELVTGEVHKNPKLKTKKRLATIVDVQAKDPLADFDITDDPNAQTN